MTARPLGMLPAAHIVSFWAKVDRSGPDDCWQWLACVKPSGYGQFSSGKRRVAAHRVAYVLTLGEPPDGLDLDHLCRNRSCVNPAHLEPVTRAENLRRGRGHGSETHCPSGHSYADAYRERDGSRKCRPCTIERSRRRYAARTGRIAVAA